MIWKSSKGEDAATDNSELVQKLLQTPEKDDDKPYDFRKRVLDHITPPDKETEVSDYLDEQMRDNKAGRFGGIYLRDIHSI